MVFAVCAQRVSSDIVPDIGGERGGKIAQLRATPSERPVVFCLIVQCDFGMKKVKLRTPNAPLYDAPGAQGAGPATQHCLVRAMHTPADRFHCQSPGTMP